MRYQKDTGSLKLIKTAGAAVVALGLASCSGPAAPAATQPAAVASASGPQEPLGDTTAKRMRLMTADQYRNTLSYVFGPGISMPT
ncbi:MAG: hypothetical protein AB7I36_21155, partial [Rhodospirillaceae bacterium]